MVMEKSYDTGRQRKRNDTARHLSDRFLPLVRPFRASGHALLLKREHS
jgi:hypothetical protein